MQKGPLFGLVANNIWTFDGATGGNASNQMLLNPFVSYHFGEGWALSSSPQIMANWIATITNGQSRSGAA